MLFFICSIFSLTNDKFDNSLQDPPVLEPGYISCEEKRTTLNLDIWQSHG